METKHYGAGYLTDTGDFLRQLKIHSYTPFSGITEGLVVDLGCGTGMDVTNMADMLGANVRIVGIDHDSSLIERATAGIGGRTNVTFEQGEVDQLNYPEQSVSGVRMERVVQHLRHPDDMFREVYRVLHTGGAFVVVETIWNSLNFYTAHMNIEQKVRSYLTDRKVNNGWAGNKLTSDMAYHGFRNIQLDTYCMVVRSKAEADRYLFLDKIVLEMVEMNLLGDDEASEFLYTLTQADEGGYFTCSMNLVLAKAIR